MKFNFLSKVFDPEIKSINQVKKDPDFEYLIEKESQLLMEKTHLTNSVSRKEVEFHSFTLSLQTQPEQPNEVFVEIESQKLIDLEIEINKKYIKKGTRPISKIFKKITENNYQINGNKSNNILNIPPSILDPLIRDLVLLLNKIGVITTGSCQGHLNSNNQRPILSFSNTQLFPLINSIKDWSHFYDSEIQISPLDTLFMKSSLRNFNLRLNYSTLKKSHLIVKDLTNYLRTTFLL